MNRDNQIYYFDAGRGSWEGIFSLAMEDRNAFWKDPIGVKNRFLVFSMQLFQRVFGRPKITSVLKAYPERGPFGVATNIVRIHKFGITLYLLNEEYLLDSDGTRVVVRSQERFGPIPFLFRDAKEHPAVIHEGGLSSTYYMPLLGTSWTGDYQISDDRNHVDAVLKCGWAEASETIHRVA